MVPYLKGDSHSKQGWVRNPRDMCKPALKDVYVSVVLQSVMSSHEAWGHYNEEVLIRKMS